MPSLPRLAQMFGVLLVLRITGGIVAEYRHYLPPDFQHDFLLGRERYFWGAYAVAFYLHVLSGPVALLLGLLLMSTRFRQTWPNWHRLLGRWQGILILAFLVPSGLWMSYYAMTGAIAAGGLATLAIATGLCTLLGWRAAIQRRYRSHERWMQRTFLLLCSAIVLRLIGGIATLMQWDAPWIYSAACWCIWLVPWLVWELLHASRIYPALSSQS